jgi:hypothetical protein
VDYRAGLRPHIPANELWPVRVAFYSRIIHCVDFLLDMAGGTSTGAWQPPEAFREWVRLSVACSSQARHAAEWAGEALMRVLSDGSPRSQAAPPRLSDRRVRDERVQAWLHRLRAESADFAAQQPDPALTGFLLGEGAIDFAFVPGDESRRLRPGEYRIVWLAAGAWAASAILCCPSCSRVLAVSGSDIDIQGKIRHRVICSHSLVERPATVCGFAVCAWLRRSPLMTAPQTPRQ